jgi:hypothetical protein
MGLKGPMRDDWATPDNGVKVNIEASFRAVLKALRSVLLGIQLVSNSCPPHSVT